VLTDPVVAGNTSGYFFRFDADGYEPQVTRLVRQEEGEVRFDIRLRPIKPQLLMVYMPDGQPASGAEASIFGAGFELTVSPKSLRNEAGNVSSRAFTAKIDGWLQVPSYEEGVKIAIIHPSGVLLVDDISKLASQSVRLQPWSRLEGFWRKAGVPVANQELMLSWADRFDQGLKLDYQSYRIQTDDQGHFVVPQIPAGTFQVMFPSGRGDFSPSFGYQNSKILIGPAETKEVTLDNSVASLPAKRE